MLFLTQNPIRRLSREVWSEGGCLMVPPFDHLYYWVWTDNRVGTTGTITKVGIKKEKREKNQVSPLPF